MPIPLVRFTRDYDRYSLLTKQERARAHGIVDSTGPAQQRAADKRTYKSTPLGDPAVLRGIPALAKGGFGGAIKGSRPGDGLE